MTAILEWLPAEGGAPIDLDSFISGVVLTDYPAGLTMPPPVIASAGVFNQPGEIVTNVKLGPRPVTLPVGILGDTEPDVSTRAAFLARAMNPIFGAGYLRVTRDDGVSRVLPCLYTGGLEGEFLIDEAPGGDLWFETTIGLTAYAPYWTDEADTILTFRTGGSNLWFGHAWFPLDLSSGTVFADVTITNAGDDLAWPIFTITGPAATPILTNTTTGKVIDTSNAALALLAGEQLIIDTRPGIGSITKIVAGVATNEWASLTNDSELWPLVRGDNVLHLAVGGADSSTRLEVAYRLRWLSY